MGLMDKIRSDSHERQAREREALQREAQRQEREIEDRRREEREHDRMAGVDSAARIRSAEGVDPDPAAARAVPDVRADSRAQARPRHKAEPPAGRLDNADVQDAVEIARRERPQASRDARAVDAHGRDGAAVPQARPQSGDAQELAPLFHADVAQDFRTRWDAAQIGFVDDPRQAVQRADELVAQVMKSLTQSFADERRQLEAQLNDTAASTENLRLALQRYRSFFHRLLSL